MDCVPLQEKPKGPKAQVNAVFFRRLYQLLKIGIPGILSPEFGYVFLVAFALVSRTLCDLWLIKKNTLIETYVQCFWLVTLKNFIFLIQNFVYHQINR